MEEDENIEFYPRSCWHRCCKRRRFAPKPGEAEALNVLRRKARVKFDPKNPLHQNHLLHLWTLSLDGPAHMISEMWISIGFQTQDPSQDFRGGGLLSLQQLIYFAEKYPQMYARLKNAEYSFAICSINLTHFLMFYFQLLPKKAIGTSDCRRAPPKVMKTFFKLNAEDQSILDEIHAIAAVKMNERWGEMTKNPSTTVMDFMKALIFATYFIENLLSKAPKSLFELKMLSGV